MASEPQDARDELDLVNKYDELLTSCPNFIGFIRKLTIN